MRLLITGGAGFIGSNLVRYLLEYHPDYELVVVDKLTYAGSPSNLPLDKITLVSRDICDLETLYDCETVIHLAAESHVDRSITDPGPFLRTNIFGTENLLRLAIRHGAHFHHVSTDEVFGTLELDAFTSFNEDSPYAPRSPYAASKASSDHLVRAYGETYGLQYTITNCSNNYGPYQLPEKAIPLFITNVLEDKPIPLYGDGKCVRDYLYVTDHCWAIDLVLHHSLPGKTYCIGGGTEKNGLQIAETILKLLKAPPDFFEFVPDRLGHDRRYSIDSTKALIELGWSPTVSFETGLAETINWYKMNEDWWRPIKYQLT